MLKETLQEFQRVRVSPDYEKNSKTVLDLFYDFLAYLEDNQRFPNSTINSLSTFMFRLLKDEHIALVFFEEELYDHMVLMLDVENGVETPALYIPQSFTSKVAYSPEEQIGVIASTISQCRDYFCGQVNGRNKEVIETRALACEAEALLALLEIAKREKVVLKLSDFQKTLLRDFPNGLADLDEGLWYPNPKYQKTFSPPAYDSLYNPARN
jgi:hypothetical protein